MPDTERTISMICSPEVPGPWPTIREWINGGCVLTEKLIAEIEDALAWLKDAALYEPPSAPDQEVR